jgi:chromosome segregation ATPase
MNKLIKRSLLSIAGLILSLMVAAGTVVAQPAGGAENSEAQVLKALLAEVHALRIEMKKSNLAQHKTQIAIAQLKLQYDRVEGLSRDIEAIRQEAEALKVESTQVAEMLKEIEAQVFRESDYSRRAEIEQQVKALKSNQEQHTQRETRLKAREEQLTQMLQAERMKLSDLSDQLGALEREIEQQQAANLPRD